MTVTVKELMKQAWTDAERVADAFILLDYTYSMDNYEDSFLTTFKSIPKLRKLIKDSLRSFVECYPNENSEPHTIFIISTPSDDYENHYENQWKTNLSLSSFATCDEEVLPVVDKNFRVFDNKGEAKISHYVFDHLPMEDLANFIIAQSSLNEFGREVCAAKILSDLFFWGATPEERSKAIKELFEEASKPIEGKELLDSKDFIREHEEEFLVDMSEDEKAYYMAKKRFRKDTEDIRKRYSIKVGNEIHQQYIDAIKTEYKNRICDEEQQ